MTQINQWLIREQTSHVETFKLQMGVKRKSYVDVGAAEVQRKHFKVGSESYFRSLGWVKHATQQHGGQNQHS